MKDENDNDLFFEQRKKAFEKKREEQKRLRSKIRTNLPKLKKKKGKVYQNWLRQLKREDGTEEETNQQCSNCKFSHPSLLKWIFCKEPERMKHHMKDFRLGNVPEGGYPQSLNHVCGDWVEKR